jgi:hypothetical protein
MACVESAIDRIAEAPKRWRLFEEDIRRCLVRVFPYAVLYSIEAELHPHPCRHALQSRARILAQSDEEQRLIGTATSPPDRGN